LSGINSVFIQIRDKISNGNENTVGIANLKLIRF
jgi:hypothetical protein